MVTDKTRYIVEKLRPVVGREERIPFAFLFGSYTEGRETPLSDIDLAIYFDEMTNDEKTDIEHHLWLLFDEPLNILRLEEDDNSPLIRLRALEGEPILIKNHDALNRFTLSIIHRAVEAKAVLKRLRKIS